MREHDIMSEKKFKTHENFSIITSRQSVFSHPVVDCIRWVSWSLMSWQCKRELSVRSLSMVQLLVGAKLKAERHGFHNIIVLHTLQLSFCHEQVVLAKPVTFMNNSGESVRALAQTYEV